MQVALQVPQPSSPTGCCNLRTARTWSWAAVREGGAGGGEGNGTHGAVKQEHTGLSPSPKDCQPDPPHPRTASAAGSTCTSAAGTSHTCSRVWWLHQEMRRIAGATQSQPRPPRHRSLEGRTHNSAPCLPCRHTHWNMSVDARLLCPRTASFFMCSRIWRVGVGPGGDGL